MPTKKELFKECLKKGIIPKGANEKDYLKARLETLLEEHKTGKQVEKGPEVQFIEDEPELQTPTTPSTGPKKNLCLDCLNKYCAATQKAMGAVNFNCCNYQDPNKKK